MSDSANRDHWAELAAVMGVSPAPEAPKSQPAVTPEIAASAPVLPDEGAAQAAEDACSGVVEELPVVAPKAAPAPQRRLGSDWDRLAADLGITPLQPPVRPKPVDAAPPALPVAPAVSEPSEPPAPASELPGQTVAIAREASFVTSDAPFASELWEEGRLECDDPILLDSKEGFGAEEAEENGDAEPPSDSPAVAASEPGSEAQGEERSRRRRRRRRGRGKGRPAETVEGAAPIEQAVLPGDATSSAVDEPLFIEDGASEVAFDAEPDVAESSRDFVETPNAAAAEGDEQPAPRHGRRRRRRGKGERREQPREGRVASDTAQSHEVAAAESDNAGDDLLEDDLEPTGGDEAEIGDVSMKWAHRAIPTWEDTVGVLVAKNLDSRSKHPDAGGPRGKNGSRARSRDRGGRRRGP